MKHLFNIFLLVTVIFLSACGSKEETSTSSSVAQLKALTFKADTRYPGLSKAVFTIEERLDTGLVYNKDSMLFGTALDSVVPSFKFVTTPGSAMIHLSNPDTSFYLSGNDVIDFTRLPIYLTITSSDGSTTKVYEIRATVHQVDPDLFVWQQVCEHVYPENDSEQQVLWLNDQFTLFANNGFANHVYTSSDAVTWQDKGEPTGLPTNCRLRTIVAADRFYYAADSVLYTSADGLSWAAYPQTSLYPHTMLMAFNDKVWAVAQEGDDMQLASVGADGISLESAEVTLPKDFPISGFASVVFENKSYRPRAMVLGGFAIDGTPLNSRWSIEYSAAKDEYRLQDLTIEQPEFTSLTGASIVWYNHQLFMFGGATKDMKLHALPILISEDEGMNWVAPDTLKNSLPSVYGLRQKQSAIVKDNYIYLFGGQNASITRTDVYRGKLNSIDW